MQTLFDTPQTRREAQFWAYHKANPYVFRLFCRFTQEAIDAGRRRIGAKLIFERIRWYTRVETHDPTGFKLNNNYTAFYARLWLKAHPLYPDMFQTRSSPHQDEA